MPRRDAGTLGRSVVSVQRSVRSRSSTQVIQLCAHGQLGGVPQRGVDVGVDDLDDVPGRGVGTEVGQRLPHLLEALLAVVNKHGVEACDVQTERLSLQPRYDHYGEPGGQRLDPGTLIICEAAFGADQDGGGAGLGNGGSAWLGSTGLT